MPAFGNRSLNTLRDVHPDLRRVMDRAILTYDFTVICGHRGEADQMDAYKRGVSKAKFGQSPHNFMPALAVDIAPWPKLFDAPIKEFAVMAGHVKAAAAYCGVQISWGGNWRTIKDFPHFELTNWRSLSLKSQVA